MGFPYKENFNFQIRQAFVYEAFRSKLVYDTNIEVAYRFFYLTLNYTMLPYFEGRPDPVNEVTTHQIQAGIIL